MLRFGLIRLICLCVLAAGVYSSNNLNDLRTNKHYDGKKMSVPISDEAELDLLDRWSTQAVSSFLSAFATQTTKKLSQYERSRYIQCTKGADALNKHAKCVFTAIHGSKKGVAPEEIKPAEIIDSDEPFVIEPETTSIPPSTEEPSHIRALKEKYYSLIHKHHSKIVPTSNVETDFNRRLRDHADYQAKDLEQGWRERKVLSNAPNAIDVPSSANEKQEILRSDSYSLVSPNDNHSPFGILLKYVARTLRGIKQKTPDQSWKTDLLKIKQMEEEVHKAEEKQKLANSIIEHNYNNALQQNGLKPKKKKVDDIFDKLPMALRGKYLEYKQKNKDPLNTPVLVRNALKLAMAIGGQNTTDFDKKTLKVASPRFFSIVPDDDNDDVNLLSPSLFSLHGSGNDMEKKFSIENLLKSTNLLENQDREEIIDLIAEATGVSDVVEMAEKAKNKAREENVTNTKGIDGQPLYFTKENATEIYGEEGQRRIETFERLHKSLAKEQLKEMNETGYSLLTPEQLHMLYGEGSPYGSPKLLKKFLDIKPEEVDERVIKDITLLQKLTSKQTSLDRHQYRRHKRAIVLSPVSLTWLTLMPATLSQAFVLSPVLLSPVVLSPAALGPFILSPWLFVPVILSPRVLSPIILSPLVFSPVILSPLALHPFILSPGVFNPIILSPNVLSPLILSPQVGTPIILSPLALSPLILNPMAMSPLVLSPFVLSPLVLSPQYLFALVGCPHALSPKIASELAASAVVASPSFLS